MKCCYFSVLGCCLTVLSANAATTERATPLATEVNFLDILAKGGLMIYPLALMSILTVVLIFVFLMTIRRNAVVSDRFMDNVESFIGKRDYSGLISLSHRSSECMARITQKTLDFMVANPNSSFENVREVAQAEGSHQAGMLTSRITYLSDIGSIAPMVGLLGTVIGMIKAFIEISAGGVQGVRQMGLAEGVSEALIATAGGLCISIAALIFYSIFRGKVYKYVSELEAAATHFLAILQTQYERQQEPVSMQYVNAAARSRENYRGPVPSPLAGERPDLHGI